MGEMNANLDLNNSFSIANSEMKLKNKLPPVSRRSMNNNHIILSTRKNR